MKKRASAMAALAAGGMFFGLEASAWSPLGPEYDVVLQRYLAGGEEWQVWRDTQERLANEGDAEAAYWVGLLNWSGFGEKKNAKEGLKWLTFAAESGYTVSQLFLCKHFLSGNMMKKWHPVGVSWCERAAESDGRAFYELAKAYRRGSGVKRSLDIAEEYGQRAIEAGDARGYYGLGRIAEVRQDYTRALEVYYQGVLAGNVFCAGRIGWLFDESRLVPPNRVEAERWNRYAGQRGLSPAQARMVRFLIAEAAFSMGSNSPFVWESPGRLVIGKDTTFSDAPEVRGKLVESYAWGILAQAHPGQGLLSFNRLGAEIVAPLVERLKSVLSAEEIREAEALAPALLGEGWREFNWWDL